EIRIPLWLAVFLRSGRLRCGHPSARRLTWDAPRRGAVRQLPQPPRPRLRGRGLPDAHRSALLHQLDFAAAGAEPALIDVEANERGVLATTWLGIDNQRGNHRLGLTRVEAEASLRGRRHQADGGAELAERAGGTGGAVAAPVAELVDDRDADRNEQRRQHNQEDHDREEHWISRILRGAESSVFVLGNSPLSSWTRI